MTTGPAHAGRHVLAAPRAGGQMRIRTVGLAGNTTGEDLTAARPSDGVTSRCGGGLFVAAGGAAAIAAMIPAAMVATVAAARAEQTPAACDNHRTVGRTAATI